MSLKIAASQASSAYQSLSLETTAADAIVQAVSSRIFQEIKEVFTLLRVSDQCHNLIDKAWHLETSTALVKTDRPSLSLHEVLSGLCTKEEALKLCDTMNCNHGYKYLSIVEMLFFRIAKGFEGLYQKANDPMILKLKDAAIEDLIKLEGYLKAKDVIASEMLADSSKAALGLSVLRQTGALHSPQETLKRLEIALQAVPLIGVKHKSCKGTATLQDDLKLLIKILSKADITKKLMNAPISSFVESRASTLYSLSHLFPLLDKLRFTAEYVNSKSTFSLDLTGFAHGLQKILEDLDDLGAHGGRQKALQSKVSAAVAHVCDFTAELYPIFHQSLTSISLDTQDSVEQLATNFLYWSLFQQIFLSSISVLDHLSCRYNLHHEELLFQSNLLLSAAQYSSGENLDGFSLVPKEVLQELSLLTDLKLCALDPSFIRSCLYFHLTLLFPGLQEDRQEVILRFIHSSGIRRRLLSLPLPPQQDDNSGIAQYNRTEYHRLMSYKAMKELAPHLKRYDSDSLARLRQAKEAIEVHLQKVPEELKNQQMQQQIRQMSYRALHTIVLTCALRANLERIFSEESLDIEDVFPDEVLDLIAFTIPGFEEQEEQQVPLQEVEAGKVSSLSVSKEGEEPLVKIKKKTRKQSAVAAAMADPMQKEAEPQESCRLKIDIKSLRKYRKIKILASMLGFSLIRTNGSHQIFEDREGRQVVIPFHGQDLKKGTLHSIIKKML